LSHQAEFRAPTAHPVRFRSPIGAAYSGFRWNWATGGPPTLPCHRPRKRRSSTPQHRRVT